MSADKRGSPRRPADPRFGQFLRRVVGAKGDELGESQLDRINNADRMEDLCDADLLYVLTHMLDRRGLLMEPEGNIVSLLRSRAVRR